MATYPGGHAVFLLAALATHTFLGYALGSVLFRRPVAGALGGVLPDVDFLFPAFLGPPFGHRGLTHTLLAAGVAAALAARLDGRTAAAVGTAYLSHLLVDATTPMGVALWYPVADERVRFLLHGHSPVGTVAIWTGCLLLLLGRRFARSGSNGRGDGG
ncbi:metal-dependent hydrolase [Halosimplex aquaticum]|uniref:Metal-dependent hydrolase n=1 Tax=Halosimplex aquaticum TaxID=3026162 RepID=A0ABD5Y987_9EURY|nr:metal-dependent hydrolase [Halosimplex aquaticum]